MSSPGLREADAETTLPLRHKRRRSGIRQEKLSGWDADMTPVKERWTRRLGQGEPRLSQPVSEQQSRETH